MHVLVATDGSDVSLAAARGACALLREIDEVTLLTVMTHGTPDDAGGIEGPVMTPEEQESWWKRELADAHGQLTRTEHALSAVPVHEVIEEGDAADAICLEAEKLGADAIVVGSHGRTGLKRFFLGSVSEHVVRHAPCPVLVVPSREAR